MTGVMGNYLTRVCLTPKMRPSLRPDDFCRWDSILRMHCRGVREIVEEHARWFQWTVKEKPSLGRGPERGMVGTLFVSSSGRQRAACESEVVRQ